MVSTVTGTSSLPSTSLPSTFGQLKTSGYRPRSVKEELRDNVLARLRADEPLFPGIIGYDKTVLPGIVNAILSRHDFILLGLRGQAKSRILRALAGFLDEYAPAIAGSDLNESPFEPILAASWQRVQELGDDLPIEWMHRDERYHEKLATPDVTVADLVGDIDPIKAATKRLSYADEGVIHYGIIPRTNRGIFAINELPDLAPRIQVALLNVLEEEDIQIRGFPVSIPLDIQLVFTANPEDYTNRGNIITPLKDRIDSQIITHYPDRLEHALAITAQEAWTDRDGDYELRVPRYFKELIEEVTFEARKSEFVDQKSGVSARMPIALLENVLSNMERRASHLREPVIYPRLTDLHTALTAMTGKMELVYEGEQEGPVLVARKIIGQAVKRTFRRYLPTPDVRSREHDERRRSGQVRLRGGALRATGTGRDGLRLPAHRELVRRGADRRHVRRAGHRRVHPPLRTGGRPARDGRRALPDRRAAGAGAGDGAGAGGPAPALHAVQARPGELHLLPRHAQGDVRPDGRRRHRLRRERCTGAT